MEQISKVAVFFDAENVPASKVPSILRFSSGKGDIVLQRAYADWSIKNVKNWESQIFKSPITAIHQFHHNQQQAVDKTLMMDAIEIAIKHEEMNVFIIVSSDNGYHQLSLRLRELGKKVIGVGDKEKCNTLWIGSCNEFKYFAELEDEDTNILLDEESDKQENSSENDEKTNDNEEQKAIVTEIKDFAIEKFIEKMYDATPRSNGTDTVVSNKLWETVLNNKPDFNVKNYGKENFVELLRDLDIFEMQPDREWPQIYYIFKKGSNKSLQERKRGKVKRRIDKYRIIEDEEGRNFFFYMTEINSDFRGEKLEVGTNVDFKVAKEPNPNGNTNRERNGRATDVKVVDTIGEIARVLSR